MLLMTTTGEYCCNPKYIAEEILRRRLPVKIVWALREGAVGPFPSELRLVQRDSLEFFQALGESKVVIQNGHAIQRIGGQKGPHQFWLQTWHGSLGLKRLEGAGGNQAFFERMKKLQNSETDLVITNSAFENEVFSATYWPDVPKRMLGHARNDLLLDKDPELSRRLRKRVLDRLGIEDKGQQFLLLAPTYHDGDASDVLSGIDFVGIQEALSRRFGGEWEVLVRTHHTQRRQSEAWLAGLPYFCHNASFYPDIQELLVVAGAGITDYSSWICDFILTNKPAFLLSTRAGDAKDTRGFYHALNDLPFTHAATNADVIRNITGFDQEDFDRKVAEFLARCGSVDDGHSAQRIVDELEVLMASEKVTTRA